MSLYIQHGYGKSDKIEKAISDNNVYGVVLSPKNEQPDKLAAYIGALNTNPLIDVLIDPQIYLATVENCKKGYLEDYEFFPKDLISKKYLSVPKNVQDLVKGCLDYQFSLGLRRILSPTIWIDSFDSRWSQISLSMCDQSIIQTGVYGKGNQLLLSLGIDENAFKNFCDIVSLYDVKGFYVIIDRLNGDIPNVIDSDVLSNILYFCYNLATLNNFEIIIGYSDQIGIPLYCTGISAICSGWYNTLRRFCITDYLPRSGGRRPNKRYYSNKLLNSILINPEIDIINKNSMLGSILSQTRYDRYLLSDLSGEDWKDDISSLHNWEALSMLFDEMDKCRNVLEKADYVKSAIGKANNLYKRLPQDIFDTKSKSTHLNMWGTAIDKFKELIE
jgi:hypothetical protein